MSHRERWIVYPLLFFALMLGLVDVMQRAGASQDLFKEAKPPRFREIHCRRLVLEGLNDKPLAVLTQNADGDPQLVMAGDRGAAVVLRADAGGGRLLLVQDGKQRAIFLGHDADRDFTGATLVEFHEGRIAPLTNAPLMPLDN